MKFIKNKILIIITACFLFLISFSVSAATLYFSPAKGDFSQDQNLVVDLKINTENQSINTVEGYVKFSPEIFDLEKLSDGSSIISFWIKKPESGAGSIAFAGVIPGGYQGQDGLLLRIFLKPNKEGRGVLDLEPTSKVLLNDGLGTEAELKFISTYFNIVKSGTVPIKIKNQILPVVTRDIEPPEAFTPQITRDSNIFDGKWFLVFATQDKNSGIDHYEVLETSNSFDKLRADKKQEVSRWVVTESPYLLKDQKLYSYIYVRAIDKAGNEKLAFLTPTFVPWYKKPLVDIIIGLIILAMLLLIRWLWRKLKHE